MNQTKLKEMKNNPYEKILRGMKKEPDEIEKMKVDFMVELAQAHIEMIGCEKALKKIWSRAYNIFYSG